jgi:hypothetical protein
MEVRIGVQWSSRELEIEMADDADADAVAKEIEDAISGGGMLWLTDTRGRRVGVPAERIAYVELGSDASIRRVGFGLSS